MKTIRSFLGSPRQVFPIILLLCLLLIACGSRKKTGTVKAMQVKEAKLLLVVQLDDGGEVLALPDPHTKDETKAGKEVMMRPGVRLEIEPSDSEYWRIVDVLETGK